MPKLQNLEIARFDGVGKYGIPEIKGTFGRNFSMPSEWISFNYGFSCGERADKGLHFFLDDYQFARVWNRPEIYLPLLKDFKWVFAPDFSTYADLPQALQIYNHYRKHWCAAFWQRNGISVIPTISWSDSESFEWCFDGEPLKSVVAVSTVGIERNSRAADMFKQGWLEMLDRLQPSKIICYGKRLDFMRRNIIVIEPFYKSIAERRMRKEG